MSRRVSTVRRSLGNLNSTYIQAVALVFSLERLYGGKYVPHIGSHNSPFLYLKILIAAGTAGGGGGGVWHTGTPFLYGRTLTEGHPRMGVGPTPGSNTDSFSYAPMAMATGNPSRGGPGDGMGHPHGGIDSFSSSSFAFSSSPMATWTPAASPHGGGAVGGFWALSQRDYLLGLLDIFMPRHTEMECSMREALMDFCSAMWSSSCPWALPTRQRRTSMGPPSRLPREASRAEGEGGPSSVSTPRVEEEGARDGPGVGGAGSSPSASMDGSTEWSVDALASMYRRKLVQECERVSQGKPETSSSSSSSSSGVTGDPPRSREEEGGARTATGDSSVGSSPSTSHSPSPSRGTMMASSSSSSSVRPRGPAAAMGEEEAGSGASPTPHPPPPPPPLFPVSTLPHAGGGPPHELLLLDSITAISSSFFQGVTGRVLVFDAIATCMAAEETIRLEALKRRRGRKLRSLWERYQQAIALPTATSSTSPAGGSGDPQGLTSSSSDAATAASHSSSDSTPPTAAASQGDGASKGSTGAVSSSSSSSLFPLPWATMGPYYAPVCEGHPTSPPPPSSSSRTPPPTPPAGGSRPSMVGTTAYPCMPTFPIGTLPRYYSGAQRDNIHRIAQGIAVSSAMTQRMEQLLRQEKQQGWIKRRLLLLSPYQPTTTPRALEQYPLPRTSTTFTPTTPTTTRAGMEAPAAVEASFPSSVGKHCGFSATGIRPPPPQPSLPWNTDVASNASSPSPSPPKATMTGKHYAKRRKDEPASWTPDEQRQVLLLTRMRPEEEVEDFILRCEPIRQHLIRVIRRGREMMKREMKKEQKQERKSQE